MMLVTVTQSATGKHHFRCDGKLLWISSGDKESAIADFQTNFPEAIIREDYNPNQPRDAKGRWTSGGGGGSGGGGKKGGKKSGGGGGGLLTKKVSELQKQAEELGIDINSLSHKARKSVLASAIEAKQKGKDLREAGVLKASKVQSSLSKNKGKKPQKASADEIPQIGKKLHDANLWNKSLEGDKQIASLAKTLKVPEDRAIEIGKSIAKWTHESYTEIRRDAREGRKNADLDNINEYIRKIKPHDGEIARGMTFASIQERKNFLESIKGGMTLNAPSSFTRDRKVAKQFAEDLGTGRYPVILVAKNKSGVPIDRLSQLPKEKEVLVGQGAKYKISSEKKRQGIVYIEMEEI